MKQSKAAKVTDQHLNGHVSPFKLAKLFNSEASWDKAVDNVNTIIGPGLIGKNPTEQIGINNFMVLQLHGIVNEWGCCKQKVDEIFSSITEFTWCDLLGVLQCSQSSASL